DYAYCYTLRKNRPHYEFHKNERSRAEKKEIESQLNRILKILNEVHHCVSKLNKLDIKENDFLPLVKFVEEFIRSETILKKIKQKDESLVFTIIEKIRVEAQENEKNELWLIDQKKGNKLYFSQNLSITEIKYLDLVPLLELKGLDKRALFINELHKDESLPVYHYNLQIGGKNIHVIPRNYKKRIKPYLSAV
ncbi:MAG: hypothetical protein AABW48_05740, partial [Nanoarchaeota archaeon]